MIGRSADESGHVDDRERPPDGPCGRSGRDGLARARSRLSRVARSGRRSPFARGHRTGSVRGPRACWGATSPASDRGVGRTAGDEPGHRRPRRYLSATSPAATSGPDVPGRVEPVRGPGERVAAGLRRTSPPATPRASTPLPGRCFRSSGSLARSSRIESCRGRRTDGRLTRMRVLEPGTGRIIQHCRPAGAPPLRCGAMTNAAWRRRDGRCAAVASIAGPACRAYGEWVGGVEQGGRGK